MKTTSLIVALAVLTATATGVRASETTTSHQPTRGFVKRTKAVQGSAIKDEKNVMLTGSYIRRDVRRQGVITNGPNPVYVLDQKTIAITGAFDLSQVLVHSGFRR